MGSFVELILNSLREEGRGGFDGGGVGLGGEALERLGFGGEGEGFGGGKLGGGWLVGGNLGGGMLVGGRFGGGMLVGGRFGGGVTFLFKKSSLLLMFLFIVEGLGSS